MNNPDDLETRAKNGGWLTSEETDELDERRRQAEGRPTWREEREALRAMTPEERQAWIEKTYTVTDLSVLEGLDQPRKHDDFHRIETWAQARARIKELPEPERTQRLAELEALEREVDSQS